ncbi:kinase-regulated stress-responsive transcription factor skn7, partial [Spiromyces aspiralis]
MEATDGPIGNNNHISDHNNGSLNSSSGSGSSNSSSRNSMSVEPLPPAPTAAGSMVHITHENMPGKTVMTASKKAGGNCVGESPMDICSSDPAAPDPLKSLQMASGVPEFVKKLFRMLETKAHQDIVCWSMDGESFVIKDPNEFSKHILPQHFKHNNFASFVRQLNKYDFHKIKHPEDPGLYGEQESALAWKFHHPFFQHHRRELLEKIKRKIPPKSRSIGGNGDTNAPNILLNPGLGGKAGNGMIPISAGGRRGSTGNTQPADAEWRYLTSELQSQIQFLTHAHTEMSAYIHEMNRVQQAMYHELSHIKKNMQMQDQVIGEFIQFSFGQSSLATPTGLSSNGIGSAAISAATDEISKMMATEGMASEGINSANPAEAAKVTVATTGASTDTAAAVSAALAAPDIHTSTATPAKEITPADSLASTATVNGSDCGMLNDPF